MEIASAITALQNAGATVIVDDALPTDEPMYMDGTAGVAANAAVAAGIPYITAAGNESQKSYEVSSFTSSGIFASYGRGNVPLLDFDPGVGVDAYQQITIPANATVTIVLQWQDPFLTDAPHSTGATHDLDLLLYNSSATTILTGSATDNVAGTHDPYEAITYTNGPSTLLANVAIAGYTTSGLGHLKYVMFSTGNSGTIDQFVTNSPTSYGHQNAASVFTVGAVNYRTRPPGQHRRN